MIEVSVELQSPSRAVVRPVGRLNLVAAPTLRETFESLVAKNVSLIIVDLAKTDFLDSSGLGALIHGHRVAQSAAGSLRLTSPQKQAASILKLTNLDRVFEVFDSIEAAGVG